MRYSQAAGQATINAVTTRLFRENIMPLIFRNAVL